MSSACAHFDIFGCDVYCCIKNTFKTVDVYSVKSYFLYGIHVTLKKYKQNSKFWNSNFFTRFVLVFNRVPTFGLGATLTFNVLTDTNFQNLKALKLGPGMIMTFASSSMLSSSSSSLTSSLRFCAFPELFRRK